jgi:hypothetical protein
MWRARVSIMDLKLDDAWHCPKCQATMPREPRRCHGAANQTHPTRRTTMDETTVFPGTTFTIELREGAVPVVSASGLTKHPRPMKDELAIAIVALFRFGLTNSLTPEDVIAAAAVAGAPAATVNGDA